MAKRKAATPDPPAAELPPSDTNGNLPEETATPAGEPPKTATPSPSEPAAGNGNGEKRPPVYVLSYLVAKDIYVQASIWDRIVSLADGSTFTTHDVTVRKRYRDQKDGEWKSLSSFRGSELYAVQHALAQASSWILEARASAQSGPF